ncbi:MAG: hypothetical protein K2W92_07930 [Alphaproteobacteria bacterium]|nr:hypothetical protein [Alphaproteobacteria bacterium]
MKILYLTLVFTYLIMTSNSIVYAKCIPEGNQSRATCEGEVEKNLENCINDAKNSLNSLEGGADTVDQRSYYQQQLAYGCAQKHTFHKHCDTCQNP